MSATVTENAINTNDVSAATVIHIFCAVRCFAGYPSINTLSAILNLQSLVYREKPRIFELELRQNRFWRAEEDYDDEKNIAAKTTIAKQGIKMRRFDMSTEQLIPNQRFWPYLNGKCVLKRFKTQIKVFIQMWTADKRASEMTYEISESEHFLGMMKSQI